VKRQLGFAGLAALLMLGTVGPNRAEAQNAEVQNAEAQNFDPDGTWTVTPFQGCTATLTVEAASATWKSDCMYNGKRSVVNEMSTRRDLGNGGFQFDVVPDRSTVSNYDMDAKLVLKMTGACAGSLDVVDPRELTETFQASRSGPGC